MRRLASSEVPGPRLSARESLLASPLLMAQEVAYSPPPWGPSENGMDVGEEGWLPCDSPPPCDSPLPCDSPPCDRLPLRDRRRRRLRPVPPSAECAEPSADSTGAEADAAAPSGAAEGEEPAAAPARTSCPLRVRRRVRERSRGALSSS